MQVRASVEWLTARDGGRAALPDVQRYVTIGKFPEDGPEWPDGAWSVVLESDPPPSEQGSPSVGVASFLMANAPQDRLRVGQRFGLYEGRKKVASVEVLQGEG